ncbi:hypothetical protein DRQ25_09140 [Candidatus Fermentibacteria bacterium]|nr:MAG: hypothetical protein DRQ25_09140 [Candidatus Fermentibacteria bacterium]
MIYGTLQDVKAFLISDFESALAHVEGIYGLTADRWQFMDTYQSNGQQFPSVSILANNQTAFIFPTPGNSNNPGFKINRRFDNVQIIVWHRGNRATSRRIEDNVMMYMDAFDYLFTNEANLNDERKYRHVRITGTDFTDLFPEDIRQTQGALIKGAVFSIEVRPN